MDRHMEKIQEERLKRLADLLFEVGMLRKLPRSGYHFLGSGKESVAEHSFRTTVIGYILAQLMDADWSKVAAMCLFHDLHEARTGDFNSVNKLYNRTTAEKALEDALKGTGLTDSIQKMQQELDEAASPEAALSQDADQLDFILSLKEEQDLGNPYAEKWLEYALQRLRTETGKRLAATILHTESDAWWFEQLMSA